MTYLFYFPTYSNAILQWNKYVMKFNILVNLNEKLISGLKYHYNTLIYAKRLNHEFNRIKIHDYLLWRRVYDYLFYTIYLRFAR